MIPDSLRPFINLIAGLVIGFLVAWGLIERFSAKPSSVPVLPEAASTPLSPQIVVTATPKPADGNVIAEVGASASASASPLATNGQQDGLPLGVSREALNYNKELYQRYPGLKPPLINTDGRDLGPEATQQLRAPPTMLLTPTPGASVRPFPLVTPNTQWDQPASPLPTP